MSRNKTDLRALVVRVTRNWMKFRIFFKLSYLPEHPRVTFACVSNGSDFHNRYQQLVSNNPETLYRYVLVTDDDPHIGVPPFSVVDFSVTSNHVAMHFDQRESSTQRGSSERHVDFDIRRESKRLWKQARNEFSICFDHPVDGFRSRLDASGISAGHPASSRGWAPGRLDGLIIPDSGLTYVWQ